MRLLLSSLPSCRARFTPDISSTWLAPARACSKALATPNPGSFQASPLMGAPVAWLGGTPHYDQFHEMSGINYKRLYFFRWVLARAPTAP